MGAEILGVRPVPAVADRDVELAIGAEAEARAEMPARSAPRPSGEDQLEAANPVAGQSGRGDGGGLAAPGVPGQAQEDAPVAREVGVQHDVHQPALAVGLDPGKTAQRPRGPSPAVEDAETAVLFGNQNPAVGQEGHAPRLVERPADGHQAEIVLLRAVVARFRRLGGAGKDGGEDERGAERAGPASPGPVAGQSATSISSVG